MPNIFLKRTLDITIKFKHLMDEYKDKRMPTRDTASRVVKNNLDKIKKRIVA